MINDFFMCNEHASLPAKNVKILCLQRNKVLRDRVPSGCFEIQFPIYFIC